MSLWFLIIAVLLTGCSAKMTIIRNDKGQIKEMLVNRAGKYSYKGEDGEASVDTKFEPFKEVVSIGPKIK